MKDVAVIIINYNTASYTLQCVKSVVEKTDKAISFEIIVVDNASQKEDYIFLQEHIVKFENVKLTRSARNLGFGGGNMEGFKYAKAEYLLFLNNDTCFQNDCLNILHKFMQSNIEAALATAQNYDEEGRFVTSFDHFKGLRKMILGRRFLEAANPEKYPSRSKQYKEPMEVNWVKGAFMFFRRKDFEEAGGFDPNIFLYSEEMDIGYRLRKNDRKTFIVPNAKVTHYEGKSTPKRNNLRRENLISYLYIIKKNEGLFKFWIIRLYLAIIFTLKPKKWDFYEVLLASNPLKYSAKPQTKECRS